MPVINLLWRSLTLFSGCCLDLKMKGHRSFVLLSLSSLLFFLDFYLQLHKRVAGLIKSIEKTFFIRKELYDDDNKPKAIVVLVHLLHPIGFFIRGWKGETSLSWFCLGNFWRKSVSLICWFLRAVTFFGALQRSLMLIRWWASFILEAIALSSCVKIRNPRQPATCAALQVAGLDCGCIWHSPLALI